MTKKDFELIASVLSSTRPDPAESGDAWYIWSKTAKAFAAELAKLNPRFDESRFLRAARHSA